LEGKERINHPLDNFAKFLDHLPFTRPTTRRLLWRGS
jgi:hypothetical protein